MGKRHDKHWGGNTGDGNNALISKVFIKQREAGWIVFQESRVPLYRPILLPTVYKTQVYAGTADDHRVFDLLWDASDWSHFVSLEQQ
jgi:hypothetical protein